MNEMTKVPEGTFSLTPTNLQEAMKFAELIANSTLAPKDYHKQPGNVLIAMQMGMELGLPPMQSIQNIAVINGRPSVWGDAIPALCKAHPRYEYMSETFDEATMTATCRIKRKGEDEQVRTFSQEDAQTAGLWKKQGPWTQYPKRMLQMRARAFACRDVFPDALKGIAVAEEAQDMKPMGDAVVISRGEDTDALNKKLLEQAKAKQDAAPAATAETQESAPAAEAPPTLDAVVKSIRAAASQEALDKAGIEARKLENTADKKEPRRECAKRKKELEAATVATNQGPEGGPFSRSEILAKLQAAKTTADVDAVLDVVNALPDGTDTEKQMKSDMKKAYLERRRAVQAAEEAQG